MSRHADHRGDDHGRHHDHHHDHDHRETMRAVVWEGKPFHMNVRSVPKPKIQDPTDAILRITAAAICGSDIHTYHGKLGSENPPWPMGHEAVGVVIEIGKGVQSVKVGDKAVIPAGPDDGHFNLTVPALSSGEIATFGLGSDFGNLGGCQAEYVRCPFADQSLIPIPPPTKPLPPFRNNHHDHHPFHPSHVPSPPTDLDYLLVSDIWSTAWIALDFSNFQAGDTVAVFGVGPVGLLCVYNAFLRGASRVYAVDHVPARLDKAASIGAIPINFRTGGDPVDQILKFEPGGVTRSCDCCGFECVNEHLKPEADIIIRNAVRVTSAGGGIGVAGAYTFSEKSAGTPRGDPRINNISFPIAEFWDKGLSMRAGLVEPIRMAPMMVELLHSGRAKPGSVVVSSQIGIEEAPDGYARFSAQKETKVVIRFPWGGHGGHCDDDDHHHRRNGGITEQEEVEEDGPSRYERRYVNGGDEGRNGVGKGYGYGYNSYKRLKRRFEEVQ